MYLAVELGTIDLNPVFKGALATILYFLVGTAVLVLGFFVVDILTPGKLRQLVFIDRRPNAVMRACANYIALAAEPDGAGWRWQTWHLYPAPPGGTVVYTTSRWRP